MRECASAPDTDNPHRLTLEVFDGGARPSLSEAVERVASPADVRRALRAVLEVCGKRPHGNESGLFTPDETTAYLAGQANALDEVAAAAAEAWPAASGLTAGSATGSAAGFSPATLAAVPDPFPAARDHSDASPSARSLLVVDGDGTVVATFSTQEWERAHAWANMRAAEPLTHLPVRMEDLRARETWTIDATGCRYTAWAKTDDYLCCSPDGSVADGAVPDGAVPEGAVPDGTVPDRLVEFG